MEVGIMLLLLLFGYNIAENNNEEITISENEDVIIQNEESIVKDFDYDYVINKKTGERFFKNNYQLKIKQFHYEGNVRKTDSISRMALSSADLKQISDSYNNKDYNGVPYEILFSFKSQLKANKEETIFESKYKINYAENYSENIGVNSKFEINLEKNLNIKLNEKINISHKNYEYEITLTKHKKSDTYENVELLNCKGDITCEILKENTIFFKNGKTVVPPIEKKKTNLKINKKTITFDNYIIHEVKKGENIGEIAEKYNIPPLLIKKLNNKTNYVIEINEKILIANKSTKIHKIGTGDTLFKISKKYNIKISSIKKMNDLKSDLIYEGYYLIIKK